MGNVDISQSTREEFLQQISVLLARCANAEYRVKELTNTLKQRESAQRDKFHARRGETAAKILAGLLTNQSLDGDIAKLIPVSVEMARMLAIELNKPIVRAA